MGMAVVHAAARRRLLRREHAKMVDQKLRFDWEQATSSPYVDYTITQMLLKIGAGIMPLPAYLPDPPLPLP